MSFVPADAYGDIDSITRAKAERIRVATPIKGFAVENTEPREPYFALRTGFRDPAATSSALAAVTPLF